MKEIEELYFCYVLPFSLPSSDVIVNDDEVMCTYPSSFHGTFLSDAQTS